MEESLNNLMLWLNNYQLLGYPLDEIAPPILIVLGGLLILADYLFDTDVPAHFGYVCFAVAAFLMSSVGFRESYLIGLLVWSMLLNMHFMFLRELLERDVDGQEIASE